MATDRGCPAPLTCCDRSGRRRLRHACRVTDESETTTEHAPRRQVIVGRWPLPTGTDPAHRSARTATSTTARGSSEGSQSRANPDGTPEPVDHPPLDRVGPDFDGPIPPLVDEHGRAWVVIDGTISGSTPGPRPGRFPVSAANGAARTGQRLWSGDTGCQSWIEPPRIAPRGLVYSLETGPAGGGDRLTVVNPDGTISSGWPKTLQREGARWDSVTIGENRVAYAVAIEPEPSKGFSSRSWRSRQMVRGTGSGRSSNPDARVVGVRLRTGPRPGTRRPS